MARVLKVLEVPSPALRAKAQPVAAVDDDIRRMLDDMLATMYAHNGVGLSGNQVGVLKRVAVIDASGDGEPPRPYKLVNPRITGVSAETIGHNEGCLSVPKEYACVDRHVSVTAAYTDENGAERTLAADGLLAIALQHELDHLDGKLFIDYLTPFKRGRLLRHLEKRRKKEAEESA
ncbi:MAG: peptide deformylase [Alphaproteobacteria bacterium]|nr:peptide deformylase [Alphaproteobacteria bacterium]